MTKDTTREKRLDYLVEEFKADSEEYKDIKTPEDMEGKRRLLRSLMNLRVWLFAAFQRECFISRIKGQRRLRSRP